MNMNIIWDKKLTAGFTVLKENICVILIPFHWKM